MVKRRGGQGRGKIRVRWRTNQPQEAEIAVGKIMKALEDRKIGMNEGLVRIREVIADEMVLLIQNQIFYNKSIITGRLWNSITRNPEHLDPSLDISIHMPVDVGTNVFYAPYVEAKKPFMKPVFDENVARWEARFADEAQLWTE